MGVPPPWTCTAPVSRSALYRRTCDRSGVEVVTYHPPRSPYVIYECDIWWSDAWDPLDYGRPVDLSKPFFEQFSALFRDVPPSHWAYNSVTWASTNGIMNGPDTMPGSFDPAGVANRAQLATVLARYDELIRDQLDALDTRLDRLERGSSSSSSSRSSLGSSSSWMSSWSSSLSSMSSSGMSSSSSSSLSSSSSSFGSSVSGVSSSSSSL